MSRLFAIPDIHGRKDLLDKVLKQLMDNEKMDFSQDKLIVLGDMVDRGPDSKGVLDTLRELMSKHPGRVIVLRGNHELMMIDALRRGSHGCWELWLWNGGGATIRSFTGNDGLHGSGIPQEHLTWLESLPLFHEEEGFFFSHAPLPREEDRKSILKGSINFLPEELTWTYFTDEKGKSRHHEKDGKPVVGVCGHIHRLSSGLFAPRHYPNYLFLDAGAGCHEKAPLVCTEVVSRKTVWAWPDGVTPIVNKKRYYIPLPPDVSA